MRCRRKAFAPALVSVPFGGGSPADPIPDGIPFAGIGYLFDKYEIAAGSVEISQIGIELMRVTAGVVGRFDPHGRGKVRASRTPREHTHADAGDRQSSFEGVRRDKAGRGRWRIVRCQRAGGPRRMDVRPANRFAQNRLQLLDGDDARPEEDGMAPGQVHDRRFDADFALASFQDHVQRISELCPHVSRSGR